MATLPHVLCLRVLGAKPGILACFGGLLSLSRQGHGASRASCLHGRPPLFVCMGRLASCEHAEAASADELAANE